MPNAWNDFQHSVGGMGYSKAEIRDMYYASQSSSSSSYADSSSSYSGYGYGSSSSSYYEPTVGYSSSLYESSSYVEPIAYKAEPRESSKSTSSASTSKATSKPRSAESGKTRIKVEEKPSSYAIPSMTDDEAKPVKGVSKSKSKYVDNDVVDLKAARSRLKSTGKSLTSEEVKPKYSAGGSKYDDKDAVDLKAVKARLKTTGKRLTFEDVKPKYEEEYKSSSSQFELYTHDVLKSGLDSVKIAAQREREYDYPSTDGTSDTSVRRPDFRVSESRPGGKGVIVDSKYYKKSTLPTSEVKKTVLDKKASRSSGAILVVSKDTKVSDKAKEYAKKEGAVILTDDGKLKKALPRAVTEIFESEE